MASNEAKVKVRVDTRQAKGELRGLTKEGAKASRGVGAGLRSVMGRGFAVLGIGAGIGAAAALLKGPTQGGISAIFGQTFGAAGHVFAQGMLGEKGFEAQGRAKALGEIAQLYGPIRGITGKEPQGAFENFEFRAKRYTDFARGRGEFLADPKYGNEAARELVGGMKEVADKLDQLNKSLIGGRGSTFTGGRSPKRGR